jgi:hypothetical protein
MPAAQGRSYQGFYDLLFRHERPLTPLEVAVQILQQAAFGNETLIA